MNKKIRYFESGSIWHICNKSISHFGIFNHASLGNRFLQTIDYYNNQNCVEKFGRVLKSKNYVFTEPLLFSSQRIIKILCYCIMPDHYHLLVKIIQENCLSKYIATIQNSFTRYFNLKYHRKGPLWQSKFRCSFIENNNILLHVMRYIHLNPITNNLIDDAAEWKLSSYSKYLKLNFLQEIKEISIKNKNVFKKFTESQIEYQKILKEIKKSLLD